MKRKKIKSNFPTPLLILVFVFFIIIVFSLGSQNNGENQELMELRNRLNTIESDNFILKREIREKCGPLDIRLMCNRW